MRKSHGKPVECVRPPEPTAGALLLGRTRKWVVCSETLIQLKQVLSQVSFSDDRGAATFIEHVLNKGTFA